MLVVIAVKERAKFSGIAYHPLIKKPWFSLIIGKRIKLLFRMHKICLKLFLYRYNTELLATVDYVTICELTTNNFQIVA